ncbi:MAG: hypothetical protein AB7H93_23640 [Vicinamibacterales bacterium]
MSERIVRPGIADILALTRASEASYVDEAGYLAWAASGARRLTHDPLTGANPRWLYEPAVVNLVASSEALGASGWGANNTAVLADQAVAPDRGADADKVYRDGVGSGTDYHARSAIIDPAAASTRYTWSIFVKDDDTGLDWLFLDIWQNDGSGFNLVARQFFRMSTLALGAAGGTVDDTAIEAYPDGWRRVSLTATTSGTAFYAQGRVGFGDGDGDTNSSLTQNEGFFAWGAQFAAGGATSYARSAGSGFTRAADVEAGGAAAAALVNPLAGALRLEFVAGQAGTGDGRLVDIRADADNRFLDLSFASGLTVLVNAASVTQASYAGGTITPGATHRVAHAWSAAGGVETWLDGALIGSDAGVTLPVPTGFNLGSIVGGTSGGRLGVTRCELLSARPTPAELAAWTGGAA